MAGDGNVMQSIDAEVLLAAIHGNAAIAIDHGLHRISGVDHALHLFPGAMVISLGLQPVTASELDHVIRRCKRIQPANDAIYIGLGHRHAEIDIISARVVVPQALPCCSKNGMSVTLGRVVVPAAVSAELAAPMDVAGVPKVDARIPGVNRGSARLIVTRFGVEAWGQSVCSFTESVLLSFVGTDGSVLRSRYTGSNKVIYFVHGYFLLIIAFPDFPSGESKDSILLS